MSKKVAPHSLLSEQIIIREILLGTSNIDLICSRLVPEVFYLPKYKQIYKAAIKLYHGGLNINITTITESLSDMSVLENIGGTSFLLDLINQVIPTGNIEAYIVLILDKYLRRSLIEVGLSISLLAYEPSHSIENLFDQAEKILFSITHKKPKFGLVSASEVLLETFVALEKKYVYGSLSGVSSGFFDLDALTQGFQKSDLVIIAGRPSMGKTAFALNLARNISEIQEFPVGIFSLEMSRQQIIYRLLSVESQIINSRLRSGNITDEEWSLVSKAISYLASLKIYLDDTASISIVDIRSKLTILKSGHGEIGAVIIDYLQLIQDSSYKNNRVQELSQITRNLKILAREFDTPIIVLSQLSRNVESRTNKRPLLSDLRESGCLAGSNKVYISSINKSVALDHIKTCRQIPVLGKSTKELKLSLSYIKKIFQTGYKKVYIIRILGKYSLRLTENHKILTHKGWIRLKDLYSNSLVAVFDRFNFSKFAKKSKPNIIFQKSTSFSSILSIKKSLHSAVYDAWVPSVGNFLSNDIFVHNSIEQDADVVLMLYRENYYSTSIKNTNITEVIVAKQRNGPIGAINLSFDNKLVSFSNFVLLD